MSKMKYKSKQISFFEYTLETASIEVLQIGYSRNVLIR